MRIDWLVGPDTHGQTCVHSMCGLRAQAQELSQYPLTLHVTDLNRQIWQSLQLPQRADAVMAMLMQWYEHLQSVGIYT